MRIKNKIGNIYVPNKKVLIVRIYSFPFSIVLYVLINGTYIVSSISYNIALHPYLHL
jgi:hypothetical protein